eukprot:TRINITY_DN97930_c0_g1_i1.p2 TRINITY_DN97930_c0_g1~~TRINITY_DN97930_c0_g1_i1.p2  ORF type:complete len:123 (-),score=3.37 TRINITY_DN97930_c0_g1_i1:324-692(-)
MPLMVERLQKHTLALSETQKRLFVWESGPFSDRKRMCRTAEASLLECPEETTKVPNALTINGQMNILMATTDARMKDRTQCDSLFGMCCFICIQFLEPGCSFSSSPQRKIKHHMKLLYRLIN